MKSGSLLSDSSPFKSLLLKIIGCAILTAAFIPAAFSQAKTWVPVNGGSWTTASNWSPAGVPVAGDDVVIPADQTAGITNVPNRSLNSMTINGNCTLVGGAPGNTLVLGGPAGSDLVIASGKSLVLGSDISLELSANATASINGILSISAGNTFNTDRNGVVTTVTGSIAASGTVICTSAAKLLFQGGSVYDHAMNGGSIPLATWNDGSMCIISGVIDTPPDPLSLGQNFYDLSWNNPGQTWSPATGSAVPGSDYKIRGTYWFEDSGTGSGIWPSIGCNVANYIHTGGTDRLASGAVVTHTLGNFTVSGGIADLSTGTASPVVNISGDISVTGGTLRVSGTGALVNFAGTGVQYFTSGGAFSGPISWNINSSSTVDFGTSVLGGDAASTFVVSPGAILRTAHPEGLSQSGLTGSVQVGGSRLFDPAANYEYNGSQAQITGDGLSMAAGLTVNNASGITLSRNTELTGTLNFLLGILTTGDYVLSLDQFAMITGADLETYVNGYLQWSIGAGAQIKTFEIGDATHYAPVIVVFSNVTTPGMLTGSTRGEPHPFLSTSPVSSTRFVRRYYTLTNEAITFSSAYVTLNWRISDLAGFPDYTKFLVGLYNSGWSEPTFSSRTSSSIQATNLTIFGDFVVGETSCITPAISGGPAAQIVTYGTDAMFTVSTTTPGAGFRWQVDTGRGFVDIADGGLYSGAATASLHIVKPGVVMSGYMYRCVLTGTCGSPPPSSVSGSAALTVNPRNLEIAGLSAISKIYDGNATAAIEGTPVINPIAPDVVSITGTPAGMFTDKNAGIAKPVTVTGLTITGADAANYNLVQPSGLTADITRADLLVSGLTAQNKVYDATTTAIIGGTATVVPLGTDEVVVQGTAAGAFNDKNTGTGKTVTVTGLTLSGADAGNYNLVQQSGITADITPADLSVTGLTALDKVYDGTTTVIIEGVATANVLNSDQVTVGGVATGSFATSDAGTNKPVTVTGITMSGPDAGNYRLVQQTGLTADITPAEATVTGLTAMNKVYDGTTAAMISGTPRISLLMNDAASISGTAAGAFSDKNTGTGKMVTVSGLSLSGPDAGNYVLAMPVLSADITPKPLTVTADNKTKTYGTANPTLTMTYSGFVATESAAVITPPVIRTTAVTVSEAGTYPIELSGGSAQNYVLTLVNGTMTVTKAPQSITFNQIPDGLRTTEEQQLEATASSGLPVSFASSNTKIAIVSGNILTITGDGSVTITASQPGDNNWLPASSAVQTIDTRPTFDNISSLFTPNSDGMNDLWIIPGIEQYGEIQVTVYNRFGQAVYKSDSYRNDWDGTWNGYPLPSASYYYIIKSSLKGVIRGVVNIVR